MFLEFGDRLGNLDLPGFPNSMACMKAFKVGALNSRTLCVHMRKHTMWTAQVGTSFPRCTCERSSYMRSLHGRRRSSDKQADRQIDTCTQVHVRTQASR